MSEAGRNESVHKTVLFWWVTIGSLFTGVSVVALIDTFHKLGLSGVVGLIISQYSRFRDLLFDNMEYFVPAFHLSTEARTLLLGIIIFAGVSIRTYFLVREEFDYNTSPTEQLLALTFALFLLPIQAPLAIAHIYSVATKAYIGKEDIVIVFILALPLILAPLINRTTMIATLAHVVNVVACVVAALLLLAIGGAF